MKAPNEFVVRGFFFWVLRMNLHVHVHHCSSSLETKVDRALEMLRTLTDMEKKEMSDLTNLTSAVQRDTTVTQSAITLLTGLSQQITELKNDPVALQALADSINSNTDALSAAVAANTPTSTEQPAAS